MQCPCKDNVYLDMIVRCDVQCDGNGVARRWPWCSLSIKRYSPWELAVVGYDVFLLDQTTKTPVVQDCTTEQAEDVYLGGSVSPILKVYDLTRAQHCCCCLINTPL